jgi:hypothetical protein
MTLKPFPSLCFGFGGAAVREEELDEETAGAIEDSSDDPEVVVQKKDLARLLRRAWPRSLSRRQAMGGRPSKRAGPLSRRT